MITDITTYEQLVRQNIAEQAGTTDWTNYLKGLRKPYEAQSEYVQESTGYDITGAYANYKKSQLDLLRNRNLSESLKNQLSESTRASYQSAYGQLRTQELESLQGIQSAYEKQVASEEKAASEKAKTTQKIMNAVYDFAGANEDSMKQSRESGGLEYYRTENGETYLTPYGTAELGSLLFRGKDITDEEGKVKKQMFTNYLRETDYAAYEKFLEDPDMIYRMLGFEPGNREFTKEESEAMIAAEDAEQEVKNKYPHLYEPGKKFSSEQEKLDYYNEKIMSEDVIRRFDTSYPDFERLSGQDKSDAMVDVINQTFGADVVVSGKTYAGSGTEHITVKFDLSKVSPEVAAVLRPMLNNRNELSLWTRMNGKTSDEYENVLKKLQKVNKETAPLYSKTKKAVSTAISNIPNAIKQYTQSIFSKKEK